MQTRCGVYFTLKCMHPESVTVCADAFFFFKTTTHWQSSKEITEHPMFAFCVLESATQRIMKRDGSFWQPSPPPHLPGVVSLWMSGSFYELWTMIPTGSPVATDGLEGKAAHLSMMSKGICIVWGDAVVCVKCCMSSCPLCTMLVSGYNKG